MTNFLEFDKLSLRKIYIFNTLVSCLSLNKAAKLLGISPPALRYEIKKIEEIIQEPLYSTNNNRIYLTDFGKKFANFTKEVLNLYTFNKLGEKKEEKITLNIASTYGVNELFLPPIILKMIERHPNLKFNILAGKDHMSSTSYDVDIVLGSKIPSRPELSQTFLIEFNYYFYATKEYLEKNGTPKSFSELSRHNLLIFTPDQSSYLDEIPLNDNYIHSNCYRFLFEMAKANMGIIPLTPEMIKGFEIKDLEFKKLIEKTPCENENLFFIYHKHSAKMGIIKEIKEECLSYFKNISEENND